MSNLGLSILAGGLNADQALLDTASNNLANINTVGYARETVNLTSVGSAEPNGVGAGVSIASVANLTNAVFDATNTAAQGNLGSANETSQILSTVESIFPEPSTTGLGAQLATLWSAFSSLAASPNQPAEQSQVMHDAASVASTLNASSAQLTNLASSIQSQIGTGSGDGGMLAQVNSMLTQMASLNQGIVAGNAGGQGTNALQDQQRAIVSQLYSMLGVTTRTEADGAMTVSLRGVQLVSGDVAAQLTTTGSAATNNLSVETTTGAVVATGGTIGADLVAVNQTLAGYQAQLDNVADSLATQINSLQAGGLSVSGIAGSAVPGNTGATLPNIFVNGSSTTAYTPGSNSAATITLSAAYVADPSLIATAAAPSASNSNAIGTGTLDGSNAQLMAALSGSATGPDAQYHGLIGALGTDSSNAKTNATTAQNLASTASANVASISGVNQNEEEVHVLTAQNAFQAMSQTISAINQSFQSLLQAV